MYIIYNRVGFGGGGQRRIFLNLLNLIIYFLNDSFEKYDVRKCKEMEGLKILKLNVLTVSGIRPDLASINNHNLLNPDMTLTITWPFMTTLYLFRKDCTVA